MPIPSGDGWNPSRGRLLRLTEVIQSTDAVGRKLMHSERKMGRPPSCLGIFSLRLPRIKSCLSGSINTSCFMSRVAGSTAVVWQVDPGRSRERIDSTVSPPSTMRRKPMGSRSILWHGIWKSCSWTGCCLHSVVLLLPSRVTVSHAFCHTRGRHRSAEWRLKYTPADMAMFRSAHNANVVTRMETLRFCVLADLSMRVGPACVCTF